MKKFTLLVTALFISLSSISQNKIDSVKILLKASKNDQQRIRILKNIPVKLDSVLFTIAYSQIGVDLAEKTGNKNDEAEFLFLLGRAYFIAYNYPKSIEVAFRGLEVAKDIKDVKMSTKFMYGMSLCYASANEIPKAIYYSRLNIPMAEKVGDLRMVTAIYSNLAGYYSQVNKLDSALQCMQKSYQISSKYNFASIGNSINGLGDIERQLKHQELAMSYYKLALTYFTKDKNLSGLNSVYRNIAQIQKGDGNVDTAINNALRSWELAQQLNNMEITYETALLLSDLYDGRDEMQSLKFFKLATLSKDSLNFAAKEKQFQLITLKEQQHQEELQELSKRELEEKRQNLQNIAIALFIPIFLLIVLMLSRTRISRRLIEFLGVLSLMLLFEFITLLLHPHIAAFTHHTPIFELIILIAIAAILVPLHHKSSHWFKQKLTFRSEKS